MVDVRDMIVVHTAMLREFRLLPDAVAAVEAGSQKRARVVADHLGFMCDLLHHHHAGEDTLLWPNVTSRIDDKTKSVIARVERQHGDLDASLQSVAGLRGRWAQHARVEDRNALVDELRRLHGLLEAHLDLEESAVLPLAASVLTNAEWHAVGEAAMAAMPKSTLMITFGMFAYEGDPTVLKDMLRSAPLPVRYVVPRVAPRLYARRARQVYGTPRP